MIETAIDVGVSVQCVIITMMTGFASVCVVVAIAVVPVPSVFRVLKGRK